MGILTVNENCEVIQVIDILTVNEDSKYLKDQISLFNKSKRL